MTRSIWEGEWLIKMVNPYKSWRNFLGVNCVRFLKNLVKLVASSNPRSKAILLIGIDLLVKDRFAFTIIMVSIYSLIVLLEKHLQALFNSI